jgi:hypothetical protein
MFASPGSRFALRIVVVSVLAGLAALRAALGDGTLDVSEIVDVAEVTLAAGAAYAGLGAAIPAIEPHVGNKKA